MKKIKLLTSISTLGVLGGGVALTASGCTWSFSGENIDNNKVNITKAYWTTLVSALNGDLTEATPTTYSGSFVLIPSNCIFDNADFLTELIDKGIYEIKIETSSAELEANINTEYEEPIISITPSKDGTFELKLIVILNKEAAAYGQGGEGKKYEIICPITVEKGIPNLVLPTDFVQSSDGYGWWYPFTSGKYTNDLGAVGVNVENNENVSFRFNKSIISSETPTPSNPAFHFSSVASSGQETKLSDDDITYTENGWDNILTIKTNYFSTILAGSQLICMTLTDGATSTDVLAKAYFSLYATENFTTFNDIAAGDKVRRIDYDSAAYNNDGKTPGIITSEPNATILPATTGGKVKWTIYSFDEYKGFVANDKITAVYTEPSSNGGRDNGTLTLTLSPTLEFTEEAYELWIVASDYKNEFVEPKCLYLYVYED